MNPFAIAAGPGVVQAGLQSDLYPHQIRVEGYVFGSGSWDTYGSNHYSLDFTLDETAEVRWFGRITANDPWFLPELYLHLSLESIDASGDVLDQVFFVKHGVDPDVFDERVILETGRYRLSADTSVDPDEDEREFIMTLRIPEPGTGLLLLAALGVGAGCDGR